MKTVLIIAIVMIFAIIALLALRSGGPRITQIDRKIERKDDDDA